MNDNLGILLLLRPYSWNARRAICPQGLALLPSNFLPKTTSRGLKERETNQQIFSRDKTRDAFRDRWYRYTCVSLASHSHRTREGQGDEKVFPVYGRGRVRCRRRVNAGALTTVSSPGLVLMLAFTRIFIVTIIIIIIIILISRPRPFYLLCASYSLWFYFVCE